MEALLETTLFEVKNGEKQGILGFGGVSLRDVLVEHTPYLILVVRRPGWVFCREEALDMVRSLDEGFFDTSSLSGGGTFDGSSISGTTTRPKLIGIVKEVAPIKVN
jgi:hypothetical protein